jgi:ribonuclease P protein component
MKSELVTLKKRSDFLRIARQGQKWVSPGLIVQALGRPIFIFDEESGQPVLAPVIPAPIRTGFTASKKVGNSVARNLAKRRMRSLAREVLPALADQNLDFVIIARKSTLERDFDALRVELKTAVKKLPGLLAKKTRGSK